MLDKYVTPNLEGRIVKPFDHKVACYYGCLLVRPHEILKFDREEDPQSMDELMLKAGATPIDWAFKKNAVVPVVSIPDKFGRPPFG